MRRIAKALPRACVERPGFPADRLHRGAARRGAGAARRILLRPVDRPFLFLLYSMPSFLGGDAPLDALLRASRMACRSSDASPIVPGDGGRRASRPPRAPGAPARLPHVRLARVLTRLVRSSVTEELGQNCYGARGARPGASDSQALWSHAFRNALLPLITMLGLILPSLLSGSVIVEQILRLAGTRPALLRGGARARLPADPGCPS